MQLLGIRIDSKSKQVAKVLKAGWFPFGKYEEPMGDNLVVLPRIHEIIRDIYTQKGEPKISINAIVGQNGAGKSTLLDIMFALINNLVIKILGKQKSHNTYRQLYYAYGVFADMYFIVDNVQYRITGRNTKLELYIQEKDRLVPYPLYKGENRNSVLESLFYTIITNYSLYAYNIDEYANLTNDSVPKKLSNGKWLDGLFHKNDGYYTPIVITPYRANGTINVNKEAYLAEHRINMLALMAEAKGKSFIDNYRPDTLYVELNHKFIYEKTKILNDIIKDSCSWIDGELLVDIFKKCWNERISTLYGTSNLDSDSECYQMSIFYLAYKSIKLCLRYPDYNYVMRFEEDKKDYHDVSNDKDYYQYCCPERVNTLIGKILKDNSIEGDEHNHLILKIEQVLDYLEYYIKKGFYRWRDNDQISVNELLKRKRINHYCDIYRLLPPPFYNLHLEFKKTEEKAISSWTSFDSPRMSLAAMSSGERHLLTCLSYILYHLKNIESIKPDKERVKYRNICLVFDEIELYFHPDFQRRFIRMLLEALSWCNISNRSIKSIQILLVTHSPFILTDIFTHNTLYLRNGTAVEVEGETFGANYYDLLNSSFFFDASAVGEISTNFIRELSTNTKRKQVNNLLEYVGDQMIKSYIRLHKPNVQD